MNPVAPLFAGVELGGTKCVCLIGTGPDDIREQLSIPTGVDPATALRHIETILQSWHVKYGAIAALGIASFGPVDLDVHSSTYGYITATTKSGWSHTDVARRLLQTLISSGLQTLPMRFDTDVNAAALAEGRWGAAQGLNDYAYITVGTGVGVGLIVAGRTVCGFSHPEMGHIRIARMPGDAWSGSCSFHNDCVEGLASGTAIAARTGIVGDQISKDHPVWATVAHALAQLAHTLVMTTAPRRIIIGGGVVNAHLELLPRIRQLLSKSIGGYLHSDQLTTGIDNYVVAPGLGSQAGPMGALALAMDAFQIKS